MRLLWTLCYFMAAAFFCLPAIGASPAPSHIEVGTLYSGSGSNAVISMPAYHGLKLWVETVNADGGVYVKPYDKKLPIKLVSYDDQSSTSLAATLYTRLITQDNVDILVSDSGSVLTSVAVPIARLNEMLLFNQTGTSAKFFSPDNRYIVQLSVPVSSQYVKPVVDFMKNVATKHGIKRVAILYATNDFSGKLAQYFTEYLTHGDTSGIEVVYNHGVPTSTSSYVVLLHSIAATNPDAVMHFGYPSNDMAFLRDLGNSQLNFPMVFAIFPGTEFHVFQNNLGPDALRGVFTLAAPHMLHFKPDIGMNIQEMKAAYHKAYPDANDFGYNAVAGYNAGLVIQKTLATTDSMDQLSLREAVFSLSGELTTLEGHFKLSEQGAQLGMVLPLAQMQSSGNGNGLEIVPVYPPEITDGNAVWNPQK